MAEASKSASTTTNNNLSQNDKSVNNVFDMVDNIRTQSTGQFVYSLQLRDNKKIRVSPPIDTKGIVKTGAQHSNNNLAQNETIVNDNTKLCQSLNQ